MSARRSPSRSTDGYQGNGFTGVRHWSEERLDGWISRHGDEPLGGIFSSIPPRKNLIKRSGRKAYIPGAENFHLMQPPIPSAAQQGVRPGSMFVTPPLPGEFQDGECSNAEKSQKDLFFLTESLGVPTLATNEARDQLWEELCSGCPVKSKCFEWGMAYEEWGIWAGSTEADRQDARRDPELLEAARFRLAAGYQPFLSKKCESCGTKIRPQATVCQKCARRKKK